MATGGKSNLCPLIYSPTQNTAPTAAVGFDYVSSLLSLVPHVLPRAGVFQVRIYHHRVVRVDALPEFGKSPSYGINDNRKTCIKILGPE